MTVLLDTNVLLRLAVAAHPQHPHALRATATLTAGGHSLVLVPQCLYEFWAVATRLPKDNGLGMTQAETDAELSGFLRRYAFHPDGPRVFPEWRQLVVAHQVSGKPTHDARLVAAMLVHGIDALLTFNDTHFRRFQPLIQVFSPADVAASPS